VAVVGVLCLGGVGGTLALNGFFGGGAAIPEDTMTRGLAGYWSFDEGGGTIANDASGNNNHGTLANGPKWTQGKNGGALQFDGKDDYVNCGDSSSLDITDEITIETWIKPETDSVSYVAAKEILEGETWYGYRLDQYTGNIVRADIWTDGDQGRLSGAISLNSWNHIVVVYSKNEEITRLYVNGILKDDDYTTGDIRTASSRNLFVGNSNSLQYQFNGAIDEVKIYNRALSEAEVRYHYNHGGPVAHWDMDEGSGAKINDKSGNGNDGTLVNGPTWTQGKYGSALSFDGVNDYVDAGNQQNLQITGPITITAWVKTSNVTSYNGIVTKYYAENGKRGFALEFNPFNPTGGGLRFIISRDGTSTSIVSTNEVSINEWEHIAATYDGSTMKLYVDGILKSNANYDAGIYNTSEKLFLGRNVGYSSLNGLLDDIKIYDYARTEEEIRLDYNAGMAAHLGPSGKTCSEDPASCMDYGLVGNWDMDEGSGSVLNDNSGNSNHGTLTNGPKWTQGKSGGALQFDGKDDYVDVENNDILNFGTNNFSIETWFKSSTGHDGINRFLVAKYCNGYSQNYLLTQTSGNKLRFSIANGTISIVAEASDDYNDNKWHHALAIRNSDSIYLYVDGKLVGSNTGVSSFNVDNIYNFSIGNRYCAPRYPFFGQIDNVKIYNRALSEEEVRYHYNHGGPVAHWDMDEGSGSTINDKSGNGNDGTLVNGPTWTQGKYGSALSFDGVDDYVSIPNNSDLDITADENFSYGLWLKTTSTGCSACHFLIKYNPDGYSLHFTGDYVKALVNDSDEQILSPGYRINDGNWHYVEVVFDRSTDYMTLYVDGAARSQTNVETIGSLSNSQALSLMRFNAFYINGQIDDLKFYDYARTEEEIRLDYNAGMAAHLGPSGKTCSEDPASCMDYGLVGNWDMDEGGGSVLNDNSGNNNHGTLANGPKWTQGKNGGALQFDGKDDYVNCGNGATLQPTSMATLEYWMYPKQFSDGMYERSVVGWYAMTGKGIYTNFWNSRLYAQFWDGSVWQTVSFTVPLLNHWYHIVVTYDANGGANNYRIYSNGVLKNQLTVTGNIVYTGGYFNIGRDTLMPFNGLLDEIKLYNRALSEEEVRYHYNQGGPVAHWDMDEGEGTRAFDSSGNNNHGTVSGATWVEGKYGSALSFDGADDYVDAGNDSSLNATDAITVGAWVNPTDDTTHRTILVKEHYDNKLGYLLHQKTGKNWMFRLYDGTSQYEVTKTNAVDLNEWQYIVGTYDGTTMKLYKNGVEIASSGVGPSLIATTGEPLWIGGRPLQGQYFNGQIDDVRVYNYARTAEQIQMDYQQGVATHLK